MTSKRFYYEDLVIYLHKGGLTYLVDMVDRGFFIERDLTEMLASENKENPYLMAVLLAYIKDARKSGNEGVIIGEQDDPPTSTELLTSISSLLEEYHIENIISCFKDLRWHEMKAILYSPNAKEEIKDYMESSI